MGVTEYAVGRILRSPVQRQHRGGLYVARSCKEAITATFSLPENSKQLLAPRVLLRCYVMGPTLEYPGKLAVSALMPLSAEPLADVLDGATYAARCRRFRRPRSQAWRAAAAVPAPVPEATAAQLVAAAAEAAARAAR
ncbi:unnamed protein product [Effrenium voratum]|uniref:Uncharacterized protein n=1 Tax=Effrenium voratum TaxID=2562239 RepID=A0AA36NKB1_9DINO|nr:unnamed protein product [Effrenium voratum]